MQSKTYTSKYKNVSKNTFFVYGFLMFFFSCEKPPDFSIKPEIEFEKITNISMLDPLTKSTLDSVVISVRFQDGDGDLGVSQADISNLKYRKFMDSTFDDSTKKWGNYKFSNFYYKTYRKLKGKYVYVNTSPTSTENQFDKGVFQELIPYDEAGPIDGVLNFSTKPNYKSLKTAGRLSDNDTIRFEVFIVDRNLNVSNTIFTDSIVVLKKVK